MKKKNILVIVVAICLLVGQASFGELLYKFDCTAGVTSSGGLVSSWANQGASGGSAVNTGDACPELSSQLMPGGNTMSVLSFNGVSDYLDIAASSSLDSTSLTWFAVYKADSTPASDQYILRSAYTAGASSNTDVMWGTWLNSTGNIKSHGRDTTGALKERWQLVSPSKWYIVIGTWDISTDKVCQWVMNDAGTIVYSGAQRTGATATPAGNILTRIGASSTTEASNFFDGYIASLRIYNVGLVGNTAGNSELIAREAIANELYDAYFVPEPATLMILGIGAGLIFRRKK
ncbi:MAG: hypothetical protein A2Y12_18605 [Planctomycetes bacterium GWF2_42_9]|nr:MAG: hypothetical protein A2Y12_18605 [Planctomycetes bacterium GWF2_42_9]